MNAPDDHVPRVPAERLRAFIADAFVAAGLPEHDARVCGELIAEADLRGTDTHGVFRMPLYVRRIKAGGVNPRPVPVPPTLRKNLDALAAELGIAPLL